MALIINDNLDRVFLNLNDFKDVPQYPGCHILLSVLLRKHFVFELENY